MYEGLKPTAKLEVLTCSYCSLFVKKPHILCGGSQISLVGHLRGPKKRVAVGAL